MTTPTPHTSMSPIHMPGPRSRDAPCFEGRKLKRFLEEFEALALAVELTEKQKCKYLLCYCRGEAEEFVESLKEYEDHSWILLSMKLTESYPPDNEECHYTIRTLVSFIKQDRLISDMSQQI